jgi:hypothetical protein
MDQHNQFDEGYNLLDILPFIILQQVSWYFNGCDALAFGRCVSSDIMASENYFWRSLGRYVILN